MALLIILGLAGFCSCKRSKEDDDSGDDTTDGENVPGAKTRAAIALEILNM